MQDLPNSKLKHDAPALQHRAWTLLVKVKDGSPCTSQHLPLVLPKPKATNRSLRLNSARHLIVRKARNRQSRISLLGHQLRV